MVGRRRRTRRRRIPGRSPLATCGAKGSDDVFGWDSKFRFRQIVERMRDFVRVTPLKSTGAADEAPPPIAHVRPANV